MQELWNGKSRGKGNSNERGKAIEDGTDSNETREKRMRKTEGKKGGKKDMKTKEGKRDEKNKEKYIRTR